MSSALSKIVSKSATQRARTRVRSASSALASIGRRHIVTLTSTGTSTSNNDTAIAASNDNLSWSQNLSFTSPEADFASAGTVTSAADMSKDATSSVTNPNEKIWSQKISTTSASQIHLHYASNGGDDNRTSTNISATSTSYGQNPNPEFHFYSKQETFNEFMNHVEKNEDQLNDLAYALSHVTIEGSKVEGVSDFDHYSEFRELLDDRQKQQLNHVDSMNLGLDLDFASKNTKNSISRDMDSTTQSSLDLDSVNQLISDTMAAKGMNSSSSSSSKARENTSGTTTTQDNGNVDVNSNSFHEAPLPHDLAEASFANDQRAIVVTEASVPFRITHVNDSWEHLCGFTQDESRGQTLGCLQGPETNNSAVTALMSRLLNGEKEVGTLLTNYTKSGRMFHNRLRVGPLKDHSGAVTHYVGVLCEVNEKGEHFGDYSEVKAGAGGKGSRTMHV